jgi:DinB family
MNVPDFHKGWVSFRLSNGSVFDCQSLARLAQVGPFSVIKWVCFRLTKTHIVTAEQLYLSLVSTGHRYDRLEDAPPMTVAEMTETVRTTGAGLIEWAPKVQAGDAAQNDPEVVPKTIILTQAINHATEHRAQIMAILTQLGIPPPELDGWTYFMARSQTTLPMQRPLSNGSPDAALAMIRSCFFPNILRAKEFFRATIGDDRFQRRQKHYFLLSGGRSRLPLIRHLTLL